SLINFSPDGRFVAGLSDGRLRIWSLDPAQLKQGRQGPVFRPTPPLGPAVPLTSRPSWSPDGRHLAVAGRDGRVYVVRVDAPHRPWVHEGAEASDVQFAGNGRLIIRSASGAVRIQQAFEPEIAPALLTHNSNAGMTVWTPPCNRDGPGGACEGGTAGALLTRNEANVVDIWSLGEREVRGASAVAHSDEMDAIWLGAAGRYLLTLSGEAARSVRRWDLSRLGRPPLVLPAREGIADVDFTDDARFALLTLPDAGRVELYDFQAPDKPLTVVRRSGVVRAGLSASGDRMALVTDDCLVNIVSDGGRLFQMAAGLDAVSRGCDVPRMAFSPDHLRFATPNGWAVADDRDSGTRYVTRIWSFDAPAEPGRPFATDQRVEALGWSPDGRRLALVGVGFASVLEPALPGPLAQHGVMLGVPEGALAIPPRATGVALDAKGAHLAVADDGRAWLWNLTEPAQPQAIEGRFGAVAWSGDGRALGLVREGAGPGVEATPGARCAGEQATIAVFDVARAATTWLCPSHRPSQIRFVPPGPDGRRSVLSSGTDAEFGHTVEVCAVETGECGRLEGNGVPGPIPLASTLEMARTLTVVDGHEVRFWDARRQYDRTSLQGELSDISNYCPPFAMLRQLMPITREALRSELKQCYARIGRGTDFDPTAPGPQAAPEAEVTWYARVNRDFPPDPAADGPTLTGLRHQLEELEEDARWLPEGTEPHAESRAKRAAVNVEFANEVGRSKRPDADAAVRQALRTARHFYRTAIQSGPKHRRLGWYRELLSVSERLSGNRFAPEVLDDACQEDILIDELGTDEAEVSFARSRHCANLLADAAFEAKRAGDIANAAKLLADASAAYPPHRRGLSPEEKKSLYFEIERIRAARDELQRSLRQASPVGKGAR
ncbi:MAG: WD40 repeat domain-containing protein, partial [Myxococcales bacterium]|nr:WD40 repeat domain-containing protein [Myxococcales bacterium]